jgi:hypothetical protein
MRGSTARRIPTRKARAKTLKRFRFSESESRPGSRYVGRGDSQVLGFLTPLLGEQVALGGEDKGACQTIPDELANGIGLLILAERERSGLGPA